MMIRPRTLTEQVIQDLRDRIARGEYAIGGRLPTGKQLAAAYGVSAMVIREVTEHLRAHGYIETRQGIGSIVRASTPHSGFSLPPHKTLDAAELAAIYELRLDLECAVAALAAARRDARDVAELGAILRRLEHGLHEPGASQADTAFHIRIAAASGNKYHQQLSQYLNTQLYQAVRTVRENTGRAAGLPEQVHQEHVAIFEAIEIGDPMMARAATASHLLRAMTRLGLRQQGTANTRADAVPADARPARHDASSPPQRFPPPETPPT